MIDLGKMKCYLDYLVSVFYKNKALEVQLFISNPNYYKFNMP